MLPPDVINIAQYVAPPTVGAFIGYLTNKIAIKMLFRPLKPWYVLGMRVPMTPGVIPAKRHELADNMGKMVADHLLTSAEIEKALSQTQVRETLHQKICEKGEILADKEFGTLESLLPKEFSIYYGIGMFQLSSKITSSFGDYLASDTFDAVFDHAFDDFVDGVLGGKLLDYMSEQTREDVFDKTRQLLQEKFATFAASDVSKEWVQERVAAKIGMTLSQQKTLNDVLPGSAVEAMKGLVNAQIPTFLQGLGSIVQQDDIREKIISGACGGVESFIASMGPMAAMVQGFVKMETVREKLEEYLVEKDEVIQNWVQGEEMHSKIADILDKNITQLLATPIIEFIDDVQDVDAFAGEIADGIHGALQDQDLQQSLATIVVGELAGFCDGEKKVQDLISGVAGEEALSNLRISVRTSAKKVIRSSQVKELYSSAIENLIGRLKIMKIGKLGRFINPNMREDIYSRLQNYISSALIREVPSMVKAFSLKEIISEKINSLDLLKLEGLLLSIMEEQFKYINLFGALLGFILGCVNLIFLTMA